MSDRVIEIVGELENENVLRILAYRILHQKDVLMTMLTKGMQFARGAAQETFPWLPNIRPYMPLVFKTVGTVGVVYLYLSIKNYYQRSSRLHRDRILATFFIGAGTLMYYKSICAFSESLKDNNQKWIPCLGCAIVGYWIAVESVGYFGRTVLFKTLPLECSQLLFGPTLLGGATYYLKCVRNYDGRWGHCLAMLVSLALGNRMAYFGHRRIAFNNERKWLLFMGVEEMIGGCISCFAGLVLVIHAANNDFNPILTAIFSTMIYIGIVDIIRAFQSFQRYTEMDREVFRCISGMIGGTVVFVTTITCMKFVNSVALSSIFMVLSGIGLSSVWLYTMDLKNIVPLPVFHRYCQQVLGPILTIYTSLSSAYIGYHVGWKFSLPMMVFLSVGIYITYKGYN